MKCFGIILGVFLLFSTGFSYAQLIKQDTLPADTLIKVRPEKPHSPTKATLLSTFLPGAGQVYNKKYWKVPVVFATIGTSLYFAISNQQNFNDFKQAYLYRIDGDPNTVDDYVDVLSEAGLKANMDYHQRNRDLAYIFTGVFYVLNIVDAAVDAHLFNFPKNDKLSFNLQPCMDFTASNRMGAGFTLVVNL
ncbi:MAG: hypothetical protein KDD41_10120 [Flavobacteriales bacterium]|nr:hypothetical protein [Flavobacteriales bacterium]